jgi:hypothetical protein
VQLLILYGLPCRSIIMENMVRNGTNHVFNLAFRILRSSVSLHSASRAIGGVSSQVAKLSMDDEYREIRDQQSQQEARHLGEGLAGGGEAFAKSVLWYCYAAAHPAPCTWTNALSLRPIQQSCVEVPEPEHPRACCTRAPRTFELAGFGCAA